jgi:hypothetical protein
MIMNTKKTIGFGTKSSPPFCLDLPLSDGKVVDETTVRKKKSTNTSRPAISIFPRRQEQQ